MQFVDPVRDRQDAVITLLHSLSLPKKETSSQLHSLSTRFIFSTVGKPSSQFHGDAYPSTQFCSPELEPRQHTLHFLPVNLPTHLTFTYH